ncbi:MAG: DUF2232 domain-containing protein [Thermodesulfobacteria bacterium]|nr:DUF2232 domain-containing protein [Thermodesulfobacteriota bacterium]
MNSHISKGNGKAQRGLYKDYAVAAGALVAPCLMPELNSVLQFFIPGAAAAYLDNGSLQKRLFFLLALYVLISVAFFSAGMVASALILAQAVVICGVIVISAFRGVDAPKNVIILSITIFLMSMVVVGMSSGWKMHELYTQMVTAMTKEYDKAVELYKKSSGTSMPPQLDQLVANVKATLVAYFPGIICSFFVFLSFTNTLAFMRISMLRGRGTGLMPEFNEWRMPGWLVWFFIVFGFMALMPDGPWPAIGRNGILVVCIFYLIQGFSVMQFFFKVMQTPIYVRYLVYALIGIQWYGLLLVVFTGLMDYWFDFRKRLIDRLKSSEDNEE